MGPPDGRRAGGGREGGPPSAGRLALPLPKATASAIENIADRPRTAMDPRGGARLCVDNVGLWLDKLIFRRSGVWTLDKADRTDALGRVCGRRRSEIGAAGLERLQETVKALHPADESQVFEGETHGRLLVDYGRATAAEASVSFHPIWGVPRIPASALKGITRAQMIAEGTSAAEVDALFGPAPERGGDEPLERGRIAFYDAVPRDGEFELALDVLTPHHRTYYDKKGPPAEWEDPVPFTFVTVVKTRFVFLLGALPHGSDDWTAERRKADLEGVRDALRSALEEAGVGAKTGAGYGRFSFGR